MDTSQNPEDAEWAKGPNLAHEARQDTQQPLPPVQEGDTVPRDLEKGSIPLPPAFTA